uniref:Uncharacterized protein n=1 Tax=Human herpesvirus 1 TaxID=10298 RepID=A0A2Z4H8L0_HHV1|nr:hypothetical protein [Human alphaherpesvirus 1]
MSRRCSRRVAWPAATVALSPEGRGGVGFFGFLFFFGFGSTVGAAPRAGGAGVAGPPFAAGVAAATPGVPGALGAADATRTPSVNPKSAHTTNHRRPRVGAPWRMAGLRGPVVPPVR